MRNGNLISDNGSIDNKNVINDKRLSSNSFSSCNSTSSSGLELTTENSPSSSCSEEIAEDAATEESNFPQQMRYLRRKITEELLDTERDYVKLLHSLVQVF